MISQGLLAEFWDFADPVLSEQRFRKHLSGADFSASERAELTTQLARALGLQGRFAEGLALLEALAAGRSSHSAVLADSHPTAEDGPSAGASAAADTNSSATTAPSVVAASTARKPTVRDLDQFDQDEAAVTVRILLENGRLLNSAGQPAESVQLFKRAADLAAHNGLDFLRVDALHMLAIVDAHRVQAWTEAALAAVEAASGSPAERQRIARWRISLLNNLGWALHDVGEHPSALEAFESALGAAKEFGTEQHVFSARWALARQLRELGRNREALEIQRGLAAEDPQASYVQEELQELAKIFDR